MKIVIYPLPKKLVLASLLPLSLAACGSGTTSDDPQSESSTSTSASVQTTELSTAPTIGGALPTPVDQLGGALPTSTDTSTAAEQEQELQPEAEPEPQPEPEPQVSADDVYSGELESGSTLGASQCLNIQGPAQDFGQVDSSDWQAWVDEDFWYITTPENMSTAYDGDMAYMRQRLTPTSRGTDRVQAGNYLEPARTYRITQSFFFEPDFDWGGSNEGGKLGFGFGGGTTPSGGQIQTDGFTLRLMWRGNNDGTAGLAAYSYAADRDQSHVWGEDFDFENFQIPVGEWFNVTIEVKSNRTTSTSDGSVRAWVNGTQVLQRDNIGWQTSGDQPGIQKLIFTTFYGGGDSSWSPSSAEYIRFADTCWAPVLNSSGELLDDFAGGTAAKPPILLLDEELLTNRGAISQAFSDLELVLPTGSTVLNERLTLALDAINDALAGTEWLDDNSVSSGTPVVTRLTDATVRLAEISADESQATYYRTEADATIWTILDVTQNLVRNAITIEGINAQEGSEKKRLLDQAEARIIQSETNGLPTYEVMRLINEAWNDVSVAATQ